MIKDTGVCYVTDLGEMIEHDFVVPPRQLNTDLREGKVWGDGVFMVLAQLMSHKLEPRYCSGALSGVCPSVRPSVNIARTNLNYDR